MHHVPLTTSASLTPETQRRFLWWVPRTLLALALVATVYGLVHRHMVFHQPWSGPDAKRLLACAVAVLLTAGITFFLLRSFARVVALLSFAGFVVVGAGVGAAAAAALVLLCAAALGDLLVGRCARLTANALLAFALSAAVGLALIAAVVAILVHFPVNWPWVYLPLLAAPVLANVRRVTWYASRFRAWLAAGKDEDPATYWAGVLVLVVLALHVVRVVQPGVDWDGLAMHEMVAGSVASHGHWAFDFQQNNWALWPMAADWLLSVGWVLGGEIAARLVNFGSLLLVCAMLYVPMTRVTSRGMARILVALLASSSLAFGLTQNMFSEMTLTAFAVGAFVAMATVGEEICAYRVAIAGILLGACLLSKASAFFMVLPLSVLLAGVCWRQRGILKGSAMVGLAAALAVVLSASAYAYAYAKTGNPVFPLYNNIFHSAYAPFTAILDGRWIGHFSFLLPYKMTFASSAYIEGGDGALGFQYLLFFPAGLAAAIIARRRSVLFAAAVSVASGLILLVAIQYIRYLFPALALAMLVCAAAFIRTPAQTKMERRLMAGLALAVVGLNLYFWPAGVFGWWGFQIDGVFSPAARHTLVVQQAPWWILNDVVNTEAGPSARVAYLGRMAGAGLQGTPVYAVAWDPAFYGQITSAKSTVDVMAAFKAQHVDYVVSDPYGGPTTPAELPLVQQALAEHAVPVFTVNNVTLYRLDRKSP